MSTEAEATVDPRHAPGEVIDGASVTLEQAWRDIFWTRDDEVLGTPVYTADSFDSIVVSFPNGLTPEAQSSCVYIKFQARAVPPTELHQ
jgi:hypothetical protein